MTERSGEPAWPAYGNLPLDPDVADWRQLAESIVAFLSESAFRSGARFLG